VEQDLGTEYDEGLESADPGEADGDLGDGINDGSSSSLFGSGGNGSHGGR
jgi:hypothetical protein